MNSKTISFFFKVAARLPSCLHRPAAVIASTAAKRLLTLHNAPRRLIFFVTNRCNLACEHCFCGSTLNTPQHQDLSLEQIKTLASSFPKRLLQVNLTGGEPFERKDLEQIISLLWTHNAPKAITINTNAKDGLKTAGRIKNILAQTPCSISINVSVNTLAQLDPQTPEYSLLEKLSEFKKTFKNLQRFCVLTCVDNSNKDQIEALVNTVRQQFKNATVLLQFIRSASQVKTNTVEAGINKNMVPENFQKLVLTPQQQQRVINLYANKALGFEEKLQLLLLQMAQPGFPAPRCMSPTADMTVLNNGMAGFCEQLSPLADLKANNMDAGAFWRKKQTRQTAKALQHCTCAHPCYMQISALTDPYAVEQLIKLHHR